MSNSDPNPPGLDPTEEADLLVGLLNLAISADTERRCNRCRGLGTVNGADCLACEGWGSVLL